MRFNFEDTTEHFVNSSGMSKKNNPPIKVAIDEEGYLGCDFEKEVRNFFTMARPESK
jgi:hypothetical protein